jgi:SAM-dependent methyltransferase
MLVNVFRKALQRAWRLVKGQSMGDANQLIFLKRHMPSVSGPVLEVGSKEYGSTSSFRKFYSRSEYVGVDLEAGENVDMVVDLTKGTDGLQTGYFDLAICCSVLEHVARPWIFAEHLSNVMREGGTLYMSVPWVWSFHAYPDDYYRFSWRGVTELFPQFEWSKICYSTVVPGEFFDITPENPRVDNDLALVLDTDDGKRKYLPYLMVNMLGRKKAVQS